MTDEKTERLSVLEEFRLEFPGIWKRIPLKGLFAACLFLWVILFELAGNSTFGYFDSYSLFFWLNMAYRTNPDDEHGFLIPFLVLGLFWWKRKEFFGTEVRPWYPALLMMVVALALHIIGFLVQQARVSALAFYFGLYGLIGLTWGPAALKKSFFPMCLLAFALPIGTLADTITFPLRILATEVTSAIAVNLLGINVVTRGTQIFEPSGAFSYEVAAACGGLRSLTAVLALCTIYAFMNFAKYRNRFLMIAAAFPLAITGNITRLLGIIVVSEAFGQEYGEMVHDNTWFSLLPYVPPIIGIVVLGHVLRENKGKKPDQGEAEIEMNEKPSELVDQA